MKRATKPELMNALNLLYMNDAMIDAYYNEIEQRINLLFCGEYK